MSFNVNDRVKTNPKYDAGLDYHNWWRENKNKPMTIRSEHSDNYYVYENSCLWREIWLIPDDDFIKEEEMEL